MQASPFTKEDKKEKHTSQALSRYYIKKVLLDKAGRRCANCYRKTVPVRLSRVHKNSKQPKESDYILLCHSCVLERQQKRKEEKKRLWRRKAAKCKNTKGGFLNRIRKKVFERDGYRCVWCGTKENIGLGSLIPESRGGKFAFDNFVTTCQHCRPAKGNKLPLEFIFEPINIDEYLHEQFDYALRVHDPGKYISIRFAIFAETSSFLHQLTNNESIPSKTRLKAEILNIKLLG